MKLVTLVGMGASFWVGSRLGKAWGRLEKFDTAKCSELGPLSGRDAAALEALAAVEPDDTMTVTVTAERIAAAPWN